jgi:hypothetical protein
VKITVERCDKIKVAVSQIFDRGKSVALWSQISENWPRTIRATVPQLCYLKIYYSAICNDHVVMVRVSMKNFKSREQIHIEEL